MARQAGKIKIEGRTFGRLVFYKMNGGYYARTKSSLTGKRVKKDPRFQSTMRSAGFLGRASKLGSAIYKALPKEKRQFWMYRAFTGEAMMMIKQGMMEEEIKELMMKRYAPVEEMNKEQLIQSKERGVLKNEVTENEDKKSVVRYVVRSKKCNSNISSIGIMSIYKEVSNIRSRFNSNYAFRIRAPLNIPNHERGDNKVKDSIVMKHGWHPPNYYD
jgi:hypothetical protein